MPFRCRITNFVLNYDILFDPFLDLSALLQVSINAVENHLILIDREKECSQFFKMITLYFVPEYVIENSLSSSRKRHQILQTLPFPIYQ